MRPGALEVVGHSLCRRNGVRHSLVDRNADCPRADQATCDTITIVVDLVNEKVLMRVQVKRDTKLCADTSKGAPANYSMELRGNI